MQPGQQNHEQSFIVQGAINSLSHELTQCIPKKLVSKTLHQFFKPSQSSVVKIDPHPPSYQEQTAQKTDALAQLHAETQIALASLGLNQSYAPDPTPRKAGRPPGAKDIYPRCRKGFLKKAEPTAAVKLRLGAEVLDRQRNGSESLMKILKDMSRQYGCSLQLLRRVKKHAVRQQLQEFVATRGLGLHGLRQRGSHLSSSKHVSKSEGKRLPGNRGYLGKTDHHRELWLATKRWAQLEEANGHQLSQSDLLRDFQCRLKAAIQAAETIPDKTVSQQKQLDAWKQKETSLLTNQKAKEKFCQVLMNRCQLVSRSCQRATNMSAEEERKRVVFGWRFFDQALADIASQNSEQISVKDPHDFVVHANETAIVMSDQIPVWLKVEPGKLLTSRVRLELALEQRKHRRQTEAEEAAAAEAAFPRITTIRKSAGKPPRWRVSFIARQAVERYFDASSDPIGRILPSILLVPGTHGRLENISPDGTYIEDESFHTGGQLVERKAGDKAGQHMLSWRKARDARPELFCQLHIWSQPAATADSVIVRWQQELESKEYRQSVNLVDHFAAAWTEEALHTAWILQRLQVGVPAGCTSLVQVTDVGLAAQAKAALNRWKDLARDRMREKARQENTPCQYQVDAVELVQAALSMRAQMVEQNRIEHTVLRTSRQAGWLHFRPDLQKKILVPASRQLWAKKFPEGSDRVGADFLRLRDAWYENGQILPFREEELTDPNLASGFQTEAQYLVNEIEKTMNGLELDMQPAFWLDEAEKTLLDIVYQHPSLRDAEWQSQVDQTVTQLQKVPANQQVSKAKKKKRNLKEMALEWRKTDDHKSAAAALQQIIPHAAKGSASGKIKKKQKKNKKHKKVSSTKKKKKSKKKTLKIQEQAEQHKSSHPMVGKAAMVISTDVPDVFKEALVIVHSVKSDGRVTVQLHDNTFYTLPSLDCVSTDLKSLGSKSVDSKPTDHMHWTEQHKQEIFRLLNGQEAKRMKSGTLLDDPELIVSLVLELVKIDKTFATSAEQRIRLWLPAQSAAAVDFALADQLTGKNSLQAIEELRQTLLAQPHQKNQWMLVCPIHAFNPPHWTMLLIYFEPNSTMISQVQYFDSLPTEPEESRKKAQITLQIVQSAALQPTTDLPPRCNSVRQKDGWSCGYHTVTFVAQTVKNLVGVKQPACTIPMLIAQINRFHKSNQPATTIPAAPPPLPPPPLPPPAETPAQPPPAKAITAKPIAQTETFGCSRCVYSRTGCLSCNPAKAMRYLEKKAAKEKLQSSQDVADKSG